MSNLPNWHPHKTGIPLFCILDYFRKQPLFGEDSRSFIPTFLLLRHEDAIFDRIRMIDSIFAAKGSKKEKNP
jgi:hypothetical protein